MVRLMPTQSLNLVRRGPQRCALLLLGALAVLVAAPDLAEGQQRGGRMQAKTTRDKQSATRSPRSERPRRSGEKLVERRIAERFSPRAFQERPVSRAKLESLLLAANSAASAYGARPWRFLLVSKKDHPQQYEQVYQTLMRANQEWLDRRPPVLVVSAYEQNFRFNGKENRHAMHDVGMATATLSVQASSVGLSVRHMGGFRAAELKQALQIPEGFEPITVTAVGYAASPRSLPRSMRPQEADRRSRQAFRGEPALNDVGFYGRWGVGLSEAP
jgi:nitroreductase